MAPLPSPTPMVTEAPPTAMETAEFPIPVAENGTYSVLWDSLETGEYSSPKMLTFSVYGVDGMFLQNFEMTSDYLIFYGESNEENAKGLVSFEDLNFDGVPDIKVAWETIRKGAYDAFLWDEASGRFVEEPTFTDITNPEIFLLEEKLVFDSGSSSAASIGWSAFQYDKDMGYQIQAGLDVISDDAGGGQKYAMKTARLSP